MKKCCLALLFFFLSIILCSCQEVYDKKQDVKEKILTMENFSADAKISLFSNQSTNTYKVNIIWEKTGRYIIKTFEPNILNGNIILFDGKGIWQYNPNVKSKISFVGVGGEFDGKSKVFVPEFLKKYLNGSEISEKEVLANGVKYLVLTTKTNNEKNFDMQKLWIDTQKQAPFKLETFDKKGKLIFLVEFLNFNFNIKTLEKDFDVCNGFSQ